MSCPYCEPDEDDGYYFAEPDGIDHGPPATPDSFGQMLKAMYPAQRLFVLAERDSPFARLLK